VERALSPRTAPFVILVLAATLAPACFVETSTLDDTPEPATGTTEQAVTPKEALACTRNQPLDKILVPPAHVAPACTGQMPDGRPCADARAESVLSGMPKNFAEVCKEPIVINHPGNGGCDNTKNADLWDRTALLLALQAYVKKLPCKKGSPSCGPNGTYEPKTLGELLDIVKGLKPPCNVDVAIRHNGGPVYPKHENRQDVHFVPEDAIDPDCPNIVRDCKPPTGSVCVDASVPNDSTTCYKKGKQGTPIASVAIPRPATQ